MKRPPSTRTPHSKYTGAEILQVLLDARVSKLQFRTDCGISLPTMRRILAGKQDGDIPIKVDEVIARYLQEIG